MLRLSQVGELNPRFWVVFARYEVKRALARKKVLVLVAFTLLIDVALYFGLARVAATHIPSTYYPFMWVVGTFLPQSLLLSFVAIFISAGAMSEEYEQGTAELMLSKPVAKSDFLLGKFFGGYFLVFLVIGLNALAVLIISSILFGPQSSIGLIPPVILLQTYSVLLFYAFGFTAGEVIRRSSLSYIISSLILLSSVVSGLYLTIVYGITGQSYYLHLDAYLPTTVVQSTPIQFARAHLSGPGDFMLGLLTLGSSSTLPKFDASAITVLVYTVGAFFVGFIYFHFTDVSKRVS